MLRKTYFAFVLAFSFVGAGGTAGVSQAIAGSGNTVGMIKWWHWPVEPKASAVTLLQNVDTFITAHTDPGPNSDIYYFGYMTSLRGYTGMQTPVLFGVNPAATRKPFYTGGNPYDRQWNAIGRPFADEGSGRQFLFSLWGKNLMAFAGTPATARIGGGSYCNSGNTGVVDGDGGAQCRYRYDWKPGRTYRFRVTQAPDRVGVDYNNAPFTYQQCFQSEVTDMGANWSKDAPAVEGDKFVIGVICMDKHDNWNKKNAWGVPTNLTRDGAVPGGSVGTPTEYWDRNPRATCTTPAYSSVTFHIEATALNGRLANKKFELNAAHPAPIVHDGPCKSIGLVSVDTFTNSVTQTGGVNQSARGLFMAASASGLGCLSGKFKDDSPAAMNPAFLDSCPSAANLRTASFASRMWVKAADQTIVTHNSYCITARSGEVGSPVVITSCRPNEPLQRWSTLAATPRSNIHLATGPYLCIAPAANRGGLILAPCSSDTSIWTVPGKTYVNPP